MKLTKRIVSFALVAMMLFASCVSFVSAAGVKPLLGNIDDNDEINYIDYMLLKRYVMKTYTIPENLLSRADINRKDGVTYVDYMLLKRAVMGTYELVDISMEEIGDAVTITDGVTYQYFTVHSGEADRSETVVAMEFDPADGYIPMVFSGYAGNSSTVKGQYNCAVNKYGYDVVGAINGAFFSMDTAGWGNYGILNGIAISNGKIASAHAGINESVVAFDTEGNMNIVDSNIEYNLYINGQEINNGIYYINKHNGDASGDNWTQKFYYFDTSCGNKTDTFACAPGYHIICDKVNHSELAVGSTLYGNVVEVVENSYNVQFGDYGVTSDRFVLFVQADSPYATYVENLVAGDSINITANETIAASKEIMENANSVISNVGFLVKDGVDQTQILSTIGTHSVTLAARWTAFGQKADGSYVFFTSEGGSTGETSRSITLRDVAKFMMAKGCVNVIRMDGGGSSAMYVKDTGNGEAGYVQSSSRSVGDCILVVNKNSLYDANMNAALENKLDAALDEADPSEELLAAIAEAQALVDADSPAAADERRVYCKLDLILSGKSELNDLIAECGAVDFREYSDANLKNIREYYADALELFGQGAPDKNEVAETCENLRNALATKGEGTLASGLYITTFNASILDSDCCIFTPDFGTITATNANTRWTWNMILTYNEAGGYWEVTQKPTLGNGNPPDYTLADNQILVAIHNGSKEWCSANYNLAQAITTDCYLYLHGIDVENKILGVGAYIEVCK